MYNKFPQITFIYDRHSTATLSKKSAVEMRITFNRKQKYISTGIRLLPNQWKKGSIVNCPDAIQLNKILDKMLIDVRQIILDMAHADNIDISLIAEKLNKMNAEKLSFIDFCKQRAEVRKYGKTKESQERYDRFIRFFIQWGKITQFEDITEANIIAYDRYISSKGLKSSSKWNNYHRFLNSFILDSIDAGYIHKNPYKWINIDKSREDSLSKCLTPEEFNRLKLCKVPTKSLEKVRDLFVFQTYTCLSYSDLRGFSSEYIIEVEGMKVYTGNRHKTQQEFTIPLLKPALDILSKYDNKLPIISNVKYNEYIKIVAQSAGIDKPVSSHWARHTGATLLLNAGVDMQIVSKICGHSSTKITEKIYAKLLDKTVVKAIQNLDM